MFCVGTECKMILTTAKRQTFMFTWHVFNNYCKMIIQDQRSSVTNPLGSLPKISYFSTTTVSLIYKKKQDHPHFSQSQRTYFSHHLMTLPNALNLVKNVGDLKLMRGPRTAIRKNGTVYCSSHTRLKTASWGWGEDKNDPLWLLWLPWCEGGDIDGHTIYHKQKSVYF